MRISYVIYNYCLLQINSYDDEKKGKINMQHFAEIE